MTKWMTKEGMGFSDSHVLAWQGRVGIMWWGDIAGRIAAAAGMGVGYSSLRGSRVLCECLCILTAPSKTAVL